MERGPCYGRCPVYGVSMSAGGAVTFEGRRNVAAPGNRVAQRGAEAFATLMAELSKLGLFELDGAYVAGAPHCLQHATDAPVVTIAASDGRRSARVKHDLGCHDAPAALLEIEALIDRRTGAGDWINAPLQ